MAVFGKFGGLRGTGNLPRLGGVRKQLKFGRRRIENVKIGKSGNLDGFKLYHIGAVVSIGKITFSAK
jgi:hypothetical protein